MDRDKDVSDCDSKDITQRPTNSDGDLWGAQQSSVPVCCLYNQFLQSTVTSNHNVNGKPKCSEDNAELCTLKKQVAPKETARACDNTELRERNNKNPAEDEQSSNDLVTNRNFKSGLIQVKASSTLKLNTSSTFFETSPNSFIGILDVNTVASLLPGERTSTEESAIEHILNLETDQAQQNNQSPLHEDGSVFNLEQDSGIFDLSLAQQDDFETYEGRDGSRDWPVRSLNHSLKQVPSCLQRCISSESKSTDDSKICQIKKQIDQEAIQTICATSSPPDTIARFSPEVFTESEFVCQQSVHEAKIFFEKEATKDPADIFSKDLCVQQHNHNSCDNFQQSSMGKKSQSQSKTKVPHVVYSKDEFSEEYASPRRSKSLDKKTAGGETTKKEKKKPKERKQILSDPSQGGSLKFAISAPITASEEDIVKNKRHTMGDVPRTPTQEASTDTSELLTDMEIVAIHQELRQPDANPNKSNNNQEQHRLKKRLAHSRNGGISNEAFAAFGKHPLTLNLESSPEVIRDTLTSHHEVGPPLPPKPKRLSLMSQLQKQNVKSIDISASQESQQSIGSKEDPVHERKTEIAVERQVLLKQAVKSKVSDLTSEEAYKGTLPEEVKSQNSYAVITRYVDGQEELILGALPLQRDEKQNAETPRKRPEKHSVSTGRKFRHYACIEPVGKPIQLITPEQRQEDAILHSLSTSPDSNTSKLDVAQSKHSNEAAPGTENPTDEQALPAPPVVTLQTLGSFCPNGLDISVNGSNICPEGLDVSPKDLGISPKSLNISPTDSNMSSKGSDILPKGSDILPKGSGTLYTNSPLKGSDICLKGPGISSESLDISSNSSDISPKSADITPQVPDLSPCSSSTLPQLLVSSPDSSSGADIIPHSSSEVTQASLNSSPDTASTISIPPQSPLDLNLHELLRSHLSPGPSHHSSIDDDPAREAHHHVGPEPVTEQKMVTISSMMMPEPQKPEVTIIEDVDERPNSTDDGTEEHENEECQESKQLDDKQEADLPTDSPPTPPAVTCKLDIPSISSKEEDEGDNEEDEDSGVYDASYRHSDWIYVGNNQELQLMTKQIETGPNKALETVAEVNQVPSADADQSAFDRTDEARESVTTTTSEQEFRTKIQSLAYRRVHRKTSAIDYQRLSLIARERKVCIKKIDNMFGFRIQYSKPVVVTDIDKGGAAEHAGLRVGDMVLKVNGQDVRQCAHSQVVRLAMASPNPLNLVVGTNICNTLNLYEEKPVMSGYLHKLGGTGMIRTWKKRWFVLKYDNCLYYYKTEEDVEPLGAIVLCNYTVMKARDVGKSYAFKLNKCKARTYYFYTSTEEEMSRWAKHITEAARPQNRSDIWLDISTHNVGLPALSIKNPDCHGFLNKMGAIRKNWKRRFCVLKDACLYYYKDMDAQHALGVAHFHGYSIQEMEIGSKKFGLVLTPPSEELRVFYFFADHETDRKRWVAAFATSIGRWIQTNNGDDSDEESPEILI